MASGGSEVSEGRFSTVHWQGYAVFIVNIEKNGGMGDFEFQTRKGANEDVGNLQSVFLDNFCFEWINSTARWHQNLPLGRWDHRKDKDREQISNPAQCCLLCHIQSLNHSRSRCFLLAISSHGRELSETEIIFSDGRSLLLTEIFDALSDEKCPSLKGIPRIIILQACRSSSKDKETIERMQDRGCYLNVKKQGKPSEGNGLDMTSGEGKEQDMTREGKGRDMTSEGNRQDMTSGEGKGQDMTREGKGRDMTKEGNGRDMTSGEGKGQDMTREGKGRDMTIEGNWRDMTSGEGKGQDMTREGKGQDMTSEGNGRDMTSEGNGRDMTSEGNKQDQAREENGRDMTSEENRQDMTSKGDGLDNVMTSEGNGRDMTSDGSGRDQAKEENGRDMTNEENQQDMTSEGDGRDNVTTSERNGQDMTSAGNGRDMTSEGNWRDMTNEGYRRDMTREEDGGDMTNEGSGRDQAREGNERDMTNEGNRRDMTREGKRRDMISEGNGRDMTSEGSGRDLTSEGSGTVVEAQGNETHMANGLHMSTKDLTFQHIALNKMPDNFLLVYPCVSGQRSQRSENYGSWLIYTLKKVLEQKYCREGLLQQPVNFFHLLTDVAGSIAKERETIAFEHEEGTHDIKKDESGNKIIDAARSGVKNAACFHHKLLQPLVFYPKIKEEVELPPVDFMRMKKRKLTKDPDDLYNSLFLIVNKQILST